MNTDHNSQLNFSLLGFTSIQIGIYILIGAYVIKNLLEDFNSRNFLNIAKENLVFVIASIVFIILLFSFLALFFKAKRNARKHQLILWNHKKTTSFCYTFSAFFIFFSFSIVAFNLGYVTYITPSFLIFYAILLFLFKNKERKDILIISGVCLLFAAVCFLIPSYWYSSLFILGVAHITYGVVLKE
ncbi:MAG: hypothetical protein AB8B78_10945 [Polaribacter sp.]